MPSRTLDIDLATPRRATYWELTTTYQASREDLFRAWTDEATMRAWMIDEESFLADVELEPRPGGRWQYTFRTPNEEWVQTGTVRQFVEPLTCVVVEDAGEQSPPSITSVSLEEVEGGTELRYRTAYISERERDRSMAAGYVENVRELLQKLADYLAD